LEKVDSLEESNGIIEVRDDVGIEIEEAIELKALLVDKFRDIRLRPANNDLDIGEETEIWEDAQSVDDMVIEHLRKLDTEGSDYSSALLVELYESVDPNKGA